MDRELEKSDFDCFVFERGTITGVLLNGQRIPLSEEEYGRLNPKHKDTGCKECVFVSCNQDIFLYHVSRENRQIATKEPKFIGLYCMDGWIGHSAFYLFVCGECQALNVDYPHGYSNDGLREGLIYLRCNDCKTKLLLYDEEIYKREGMHKPPTFLEMLLGIIKPGWRAKRIA